MAEKKHVEFHPRQPEEMTKPFSIFGRIDPVVFIISAVFIFAIIAWGLLDNESMSARMGTALSWTLDYGGWYYMGIVFIFVVFCFFMAFSKYGDVKFGGPDDEPEFGVFSWFSMLFGCGMGVGLVFWSVAEPMYHYLSGPTYAGKPGSVSAAEFSMAISFFHWAISAWAIFVVVGIPMGLIIYRRGLPTLMSSIFYPLIGDRIYGPIGKAIDIFALIGTFFGMCTTIGLGSMQLVSGLNFNWPSIEANDTTYMIVMVVVTAGYLASACLPIDRGIKNGSNASMVAVIALLVFIMIVGPTVYILNNFVNATGLYIQYFPRMSMWMDPVEQTGWLSSWTIFYWAWWISWGPFVGIFIAKISKGRTIREFVLASMIAPSIFCMIYFSIYGSAALSQHMDKATNGILYKTISEDVARAIYVLFAEYPGISVVGIILLFICYTFFVVSADAACIVMAMLASGGDPSPRATHKILWGVAMAVSASMLILSGGLNALQTLNIVMAFPLAIIMGFAMWATVKMLHRDFAHEFRGAAVKKFVDEHVAKKAADETAA